MPNSVENYGLLEQDIKAIKTASSRDIGIKQGKEQPTIFVIESWKLVKKKRKGHGQKKMKGNRENPPYRTFFPRYSR